METMSSSRDDQARRNREAFPETFAVLAEMRSIFGDGVEVKFAEENGKHVGKPVEQRMTGTWVGLDKIVISKPKKEGRK